NGETQRVVTDQMAGSVGHIEERDWPRLVIAYEPIWAIGTGRTATPKQADEVHADLRKWIATRYNSPVAESARIIYGGRVKPENASELLAQPNIDGALVGGASLVADDFLAIVGAANSSLAV
ncbi:MAG TPA: triose-phosphate isomerase, partial [Pirellulaceae bacterium]|nr:triose-phosphate isomerase [Pirellulaceae bacterium]